VRSRRSAVTMAEVARRAGVSPTTVSHVLNATRTVSPGARAAVERAVRDTGYRPNTLARALRTSRTRTIGLAMPAITNPYLGALVRSLQGETERAGYRLLVSDTHDDPEREELAVRDLCERQVDGLLLAPSPDPTAVLAYLSELALPLTLVDRVVDGPYDKVGCENVDATAALTRHLAGHGHRRIAMVTGLPGLATTEERVSGYLRGLAASGLAPDDALVVTGASDDSHARSAVLDLLTRTAPPSALLIGNNYMTIGAVRALHELGLQAPRDVALAGFDDFEWADLFSPRLTTMAQPDAELGLAAVRLLLGRIADRTLPPRVVRLAPRLVVRASCGCSTAPPAPRSAAEAALT
jgi:LacI family transcriptional regulator